MNLPLTPPGADKAEKPVFFRYDAATCAHSRAGQSGCSKCIEICTVAAITADGDGVKVDSALCQGCGACSTVCPTGAMTYAYPAAPELGRRVKDRLGEDGRAGAMLLIHDAAGGALLNQAGADLPCRVLAVPVHHTASAGLNIWLSALAYGAAQVVVLTTGQDAHEYGVALAEQMAVGNALLGALGYAGTGLALLRASTPGELGLALGVLPAGVAMHRAATYNVTADKRMTLEFAVEHLARHAPRPVEVAALPAGSPWGTLAVDRGLCTLCMSCVGACPAGALEDRGESLQLRFIERNCVQCGLCSATCPENAIALVSRLNLGASNRQPVTLAEAEPFYCVRCAQAFGSRQMVEGMIAKLAGHSMFATAAAQRRLRMCTNCRAEDMFEQGTKGG